MSILQDLNEILPFVKQAGERIRSIYATDFEVFKKEKNDPVTRADLEANQIVVEALGRLFPLDAVLSEEIPDNLQRLHNHRLWILDPLDGTREFVKKTSEFAITLGLVENQNSVAGIIYNPVSQELFCGAGLGVYHHTLANGALRAPLDASDFNTSLEKSSRDIPLVFVSHSEYNQGIYDSRFWNENTRLKTVGSIAYKLGLLSCGHCDLVISLRQKNEWDICGGVALVESSGGVVLDLHGKPIAFNQKNTLVDGIIAGHPDLVTEFMQNNKKHLVLKK